MFYFADLPYSRRVNGVMCAMSVAVTPCLLLLGSVRKNFERSLRPRYFFFHVQLCDFLDGVEAYFLSRAISQCQRRCIGSLTETRTLFFAPWQKSCVVFCKHVTATDLLTGKLRHTEGFHKKENRAQKFRELHFKT